MKKRRRRRNNETVFPSGSRTASSTQQAPERRGRDLGERPALQTPQERHSSQLQCVPAGGRARLLPRQLWWAPAPRLRAGALQGRAPGQVGATLAPMVE